jgi:hypothetical protein
MVIMIKLVGINGVVFHVNLDNLEGISYGDMTEKLHFVSGREVEVPRGTFDQAVDALKADRPRVKDSLFIAEHTI